MIAPGTIFSALGLLTDLILSITLWSTTTLISIYKWGKLKDTEFKKLAQGHSIKLDT